MKDWDSVGLVLSVLEEEDDALVLLRKVADYLDVYVRDRRVKKSLVKAVRDSSSCVEELLAPLDADEIHRVVANALCVVVGQELKFSQQQRQLDAAIQLLARVCDGESGMVADRASVDEMARLRNQVAGFEQIRNAHLNDCRDKLANALGKPSWPAAPSFSSLCEDVRQSRESSLNFRRDAERRIRTLQEDVATVGSARDRALSEATQSRRDAHDEDRKRLSAALGAPWSEGGRSFDDLCEDVRRLILELQRERGAREELERRVAETKLLQDEIVEVAGQRDSARGAVAELTKKVENLEGCLEAREEEMRQLAMAHEKVVKELQDEVESLKRENVSVRGEKVRVESEISARFQTELEQRTSAQSAADKRASKAEKDLAAERARRDELKTRLASALRRTVDSGSAEVESLKRTIVLVLENWKFTLGIPAMVAAKVVGISSGGDSLQPDQAWEDLISKRGVLRDSDAFRRVVEFCESRMDLLDGETYGFVDGYRRRMGWGPELFGAQIAQKLSLRSALDWSRIRPTQRKSSELAQKPALQRPDRLELAAIRAWVASVVS